MIDIKEKILHIIYVYNIRIYVHMICFILIWP